MILKLTIQTARRLPVCLKSVPNLTWQGQGRAASASTLLNTRRIAEQKHQTVKKMPSAAPWPLRMTLGQLCR
jgi:hypothetical protein